MSRLLVWILLTLPFICLGGLLSQELHNIMAHPSWQLLNSNRCGISNSERIVGGIDVSIGAYFWLARIGYLSRVFQRRKPTFSCAGAVINELYVITAAYCVIHTPENLIPVLIRLGEHNIDTNPDCENSFYNDHYQDYDIAEVVPHDKYKPDRIKQDIALIRVRKPIIFTDFVRPICMVKGKLLGKTFAGLIVEVAGWGIFDVDQTRPSSILQAIKLPVLPISHCSNHSYYEWYSIDSNQMCVGGKAGKDTCAGDSGGPVMKIEAEDEGAPPRYYVIAIVSFGPEDCGEEGLPGIYTDVSKYILWILEHLRA